MPRRRELLAQRIMYVTGSDAIVRCRVCEKKWVARGRGVQAAAEVPAVVVRSLRLVGVEVEHVRRRK